MSRRPLLQVPEPVAGYELENYRIAVLRAREATNIVSNPSVEQATTGYTAVGGSIARSAAEQRRGVYSLAVTPTAGTGDGVYYGTISLTALTRYFYSVDFLGVAGVRYAIYFATTAGVRLGRKQSFVATGHWQRINVAYMESSTTTRRLYAVKDGSTSTGVFYIDGLQTEADRLTTYLDGSMRGFVKNQSAYYWTGAQHASPSVRIAATRHGGEEVNLRDLGVRITAILGLGLGGFLNVTIPNATIGGSQYQRTVKQETTFDLIGSIMAEHDDRSEIGRNVKALAALLHPRAAIVQQPVVLRVRQVDDCENDVAEPVDVPCLYAGGLGGNRTNYYQEPVTITFTTFLPYMARMDGDAGAELDFTDTFTAAYHAARIDGVWQALGTGFNGAVYVIAVDHQRGRVYFGGDFTTVNGVTVNRVCYWDGTTMVAMDGGVGVNNVRSISVAPNGDVWVAGDFTAVGTGVAATKGLARWNVGAGTWTAFNESTASFTAILSVAISAANVVYIAGLFTDWEGDVGSDYIALSSDNGVNWSALGTSPFTSALYPSVHQSLAFDASGNLWTGEGPDGIGAGAIRKWDGSAWTLIASTDSTPGSGVYAVFFDTDGVLYAGGVFSTLGGVAAANVASYNGTSVRSLGSGVDGVVFNFGSSSDGLIVSGSFISAGGKTLSDRLARWNGATWLPFDIDLPGSALVFATETYAGQLFLGFDTTGTATVAGITTFTNLGSADAYPITTLTGPGTIQTLFNETTGDRLYFDLTLNAGEIAVLDLTPGAISFGSNFRPNLLSTILPGSNLSTFRLVPGENRITIFISGDTVDTDAMIEFTPVYDDLEAALYP